MEPGEGDRQPSIAGAAVVRDGRLTTPRRRQMVKSATRSYCPTCGETFARAADAEETWREHEQTILRIRAADDVAGSLWATTSVLSDTLGGLRPDEDGDIYISSWELERLRDEVARLRDAQEVFKTAALTRR
jgi:hypothetical protein